MDDHQFDDLTRRLGSGISRRSFLRGAAGSALAGAASLLGIRGTKSKTCQLYTSLGSLEEVESCPSLIQNKPPSTNNLCDVPLLKDVKPPPRPVFSGRFDQLGAYLAAVRAWTSATTAITLRDRAAVLADFRPACQQHDYCFTTCGENQRACDDKFLRDLNEACFKSLWFIPPLLGHCQRKAFAYYLAVGSTSDYFEFSQIDNCGCCHDQDCLNRGGLICGGRCLVCGEQEYPDETLCSCVPKCPPTQRFCDETCVDVLHDPDNCSECGNVCESGVCTNGECEPVSSNTCTGGGGCGDAASCGDDNSCVCFQTTEGTGFCHAGQACGDSQRCGTSQDCSDPAFPVCSQVTCCGSEGICIQPCGAVPAFAVARIAGVAEEPTTTSVPQAREDTIDEAVDCPEGLVTCDDTCVDILTDAVHCGECGITCAPDQRCEQGVCVDAQPSAASNDEAPTEAPTESPTAAPEPTPTEVPAEPTPVPTESTIECPSGLMLCGDVCVYPAADPFNCGGCGVVCASGHYCADGVCVSAIPTERLEEEPVVKPDPADATPTSND